MPERSQVLCSARILGPFLRLIAQRREHHDLVPQAFWSAHPGARVPVSDARAMLARGAERLRDDQLGLKMGRSMRFGEGGAFDYALRSAPTVRECVEIAARYSALHSDHLRIQFETSRSLALIRMDDRTWNRLCSDFAMSAFYKLHISEEVPPASRPECWFPYGAPRDTSEHQRTFPGAVLRFGAPFHGFAFDRDYERAPLPTANPSLHRMFRAHIDQQLAVLAEWNAASARVARFIREEIGNSRAVTAAGAARALGLNQRTLTRKLEREGSSFFGELEKTRIELSLDYVGGSERSLKEIAFSLGFAHVESFHRAFKRWTGHAPQEYRRVSRFLKRSGAPSLRETQVPNEEPSSGKS